MINKIVVYCVIIAVMIAVFSSCQDPTCINPSESLSDVPDEIDTVESGINESTVCEATTEDPIYAEYTIVGSMAEVVQPYCDELTSKGAEIPEKFYICNAGFPTEIYCYDPINEINDSNYQYLKIYNPGITSTISMARAIMYYRVPITDITE